MRRVLMESCGWMASKRFDEFILKPEPAQPADRSFSAPCEQVGFPLQPC